MGNVILPMWAQCPGLTRLLCVGYPALSVVLQVVRSTDAGFLVNAAFRCSIHNLTRFFLWTLFVGPFFSPIGNGMAFLFMLVEVYMMMNYFPMHETSYGSTTLLLWTFLMNALVNLVYLLVMFAFMMWNKGTIAEYAYWDNANVGLWPLIMVLLTVRSLSDPQGSTSFWGFVMIPNKWYPIALTAFFCVLSGMQILWNFVAALVVGYTYQYLHYDRLLPSRTRVAKLEGCGPCRSGRCGVLGASWVFANSTAGFEVETGSRRYATLSDFAAGGGGQQLTAQGRNLQPSSSGSSGGAGAGHFTAFSGSGNRLGEGDAEVARPTSSQTPQAGQPATSTQETQSGLEA